MGAINDDSISGISVWHFFDFKTSGIQQENNTHCHYDHPPPETFEELKRVGPPNCTLITAASRPGGANVKGMVDFWRREKPVFRVVAAQYNKYNQIPRSNSETPIVV